MSSITPIETPVLAPPSRRGLQGLLTAGLLVAGLALGGVAAWLALVGLSDSAALDPAAIRTVSGYAYYVPMSPPARPFAAPTDSTDAPARSSLRLFEDGKPLGPAHALHSVISQTGGGAFSDWTGILMFSSSDRTDPRTNGRTYRYERRLSHPAWLSATPGALGLLALLLALYRLGRGRRMTDASWRKPELRRVAALARLASGLALVAAAVLGLQGFRGSGVIDQSAVKAASGQAYFVVLPPPVRPLVTQNDDVTAPNRSALTLFENDTALGPPHSVHSLIERGAFSDWTGGLMFSATDGSDPRTNGRSYRYERRLMLPPWLAAVLALLGVIALLPVLRYGRTDGVASPVPG